MARCSGVCSTNARGRLRLIWAGLLLAALAGCGGGISEKQVAAMAKVQAIGGRVTYGDGGYRVDFRQSLVKDEQLVCLQEMEQLKVVNLQGTTVTDEGLVHLYPIKTLRQVSVARTAVTEEGRKKLKEALPDAEVRNY